MTTLQIQKILISAVSLFVASTLSAFTPDGEGLYAVFDTSEGELAAKLYFQQAPLTVSNFVGLAENSISHYDPQTGVAQNRPFYDGLIFHKVLAGSIALSGSPDGTGNDGPGYIFPDEIAPNLKHDRKGILSMQNAGPNTNGSQFFFTLSEDGNARLDGFHSVFGEIVSGFSVLDAISSSPTDSEGVPISAISINSIAILREGSDAQSFNPSESLITSPLELQLNFSLREQGNPVVTFSRNPQIDYFYRQSTTLLDFESPRRLLWSNETQDTITHPIEFPSGTAVFYQYFRLSFPSGSSNPNASVSFTLPAPYGSHTINLGSNESGTFSSALGSGECDYLWFELGQRIQIYANLKVSSLSGGPYQLQIHIEKASLNSGNAIITLIDPLHPSGGFSSTVAYNFSPAL